MKPLPTTVSTAPSNPPPTEDATTEPTPAPKRRKLTEREKHERRKNRLPTEIALTFTCDKPLGKIPHPLPPYGSFIGVFGKPKSGKTHLLYNLLIQHRRGYNRCFHSVIWVGAGQRVLSHDYLGTLEPWERHDRLTPEALSEIYEHISDKGMDVLLVLDDCAVDIAQMINEVMRLVFYRRQICGKNEKGEGGSLTIIVSCQVYNVIPLRLRKTFTHLIWFGSKDEKERETLFDEALFPLRDQRKRVDEWFFPERYRYMLADIDACEYRRGLEKDPYLRAGRTAGEQAIIVASPKANETE